MKKTKSLFILTIFALFLMAESKAQNNTDSRPLMMMSEAHERSSHERPEQDTATRTAQGRRDAEMRGRY